MKKLALAVCLQWTVFTVFAQLQSPDEFLPHKIGEQFTPHYMLVDYVEHVAENSPNVILSEYGRTNQQRPLLLAVIASEENLNRLEAIRENNLRRAGLLEGTTDPELDEIAIVWLSFGVHGNEAAGPESSMPILYNLANPANARTRAWLENTVILFDPSINPDGYSRYTHWYRNVAGKRNNPHVFTRSHQEPWPGGRVNHYLFDLNRDWAWLTQVESRYRLKKYHEWLPHIHVDFHEQGMNSPYYFAPAAKPYHQYITQWQREFQITIGKNHARYFDENGWLYFTREVFDLLYPSYGDTYPTYHGAIGMTYEQGGGSRGGRGVIIQNEDTLTLHDRVSHHTTTGLSTVEIVSQNAQKVVENFARFYRDNQSNPPGDYKTYVIKGNNAPERIKALCSLLDKHHIQYGKVSQAKNSNGYDYQNGTTHSVEIATNDLVISAYQPHGLFTQILMDPKTTVEDSLTYDITAWSLPYAYGLEAYALKNRIDPTEDYSFPAYQLSWNAEEQPYAYLADWRSMSNARFLGYLLQEGVKVRFASVDFTLEGKAHPKGTLVITRADNRKMGAAFDQTIRKAAGTYEQSITTVKTGFSDSGKDLGSRFYRMINTPNVLLLSGEGTSANSFGQVWYYFEQTLDYPVSIINVDDLGSTPLDEFNVLVMPEGNYRLDKRVMTKITDWVQAGGNLIAMGSSLRSLADQPGFNLSRYADEDAKKAAEKAAKEAELKNRDNAYGDQLDQRLEESVPGAIVKVQIDNTHPLGFGIGSSYFSLKTRSTAYPLLKNSWNVGRLPEEPVVIGVVGKKAKKELENTVVFAVENKGGGSVTYLVDNPLFRAFWEQGNFLFSNAVFLSGQ